MTQKKTSQVTQAQRSAATRATLLNATIESLIDVGFAATTTRSVANRAGISQGALQHHFRSKNDLVDAAIFWLSQKLASDINAATIGGNNDRERIAFVIDRLWEVHNLRIAPAVFEMYAAARTDSNLAAAVAKLVKQQNHLLHTVCRQLLPELSAMPGFSDQLAIILAMLRGTVILRSIPGVQDGYVDWSVLRNHILSSIDRFIEASGKKA
ncbi:TetR/AcrR family transcriptional regulator [Pseudidiomarina sp.]|uniref:TetR/AcrR family transcriptional regulator n=1 Tax=Pseudidiomarina sp. TaxID=2081707 RepID=UPI00299F04F7|nr:TetR/AcrR family transcriptional regulator [Pseudidiomarina sp.]MDX1706876.1 TetR/AcrR family transcriptional regulator [Pseudidiomarina sp.]